LDIDIKSVFFDSLRTQNIIGFVPGTEIPDSFMVFSAHYDHLGGIGDSCYFPGANDNASGIAMLLNLANYYQKNPAKYTMVFIAFGAEEVGLLGSKYFVENPLFPLEKIKILVNMDMMGTGEEGIQVVNATLFETEYNLLKKINEDHKYLANIKSRGKSANSDHHWFTEKGVPAFFIYTLGGVAHYHDIYDRAETLPLTEFEDIFKLLIGFVLGLE
jgi:aminopeptidase YwaD